jgi:hypothetical protein
MVREWQPFQTPYLGIVRRPAARITRTICPAAHYREGFLVRIG